MNPTPSCPDQPRLPKGSHAKLVEILLAAVATGVFSKLNYSRAFSSIADFFQWVAQFFQ